MSNYILPRLPHYFDNISEAYSDKVFQVSNTNLKIVANNNVIKYGAVIPKNYGKVFVKPDFVFLPKPGFSNFYFCLGLGDYDVNEVFFLGEKIDKTYYKTEKGKTIFYDKDLLDTKKLKPFKDRVELKGKFATSKKKYTIKFKKPIESMNLSFQFEWQKDRGYILFTGFVRALNISETYNFAYERPLKKETFSYNVPLSNKETDYEIEFIFTNSPTSPYFVTFKIYSIKVNGYYKQEIFAPTLVDSTILILDLTNLQISSLKKEPDKTMVSAIITRKLPKWDLKVGWGKNVAVATRNPVWAFIDIIKHVQNLSDAELNLPALFRLSQELEINKDYFDAIFDSNNNVWDCLNRVGQVCRSVVVFENNTFNLVRDEKKDVARMFSMGNISKMAVQHLPYVIDGLNVNYRDIYGINKTLPVRLPKPQNKGTKNINFFGCTEYGKIFSESIFLLKKMKYRNLIFKWDTDIEALSLNYGDTVLLSHDLLSKGEYSGVITGVNGNILTLSRDMPFTSDNYDWTMTFRGKDGKPIPIKDKIDLPIRKPKSLLPNQIEVFSPKKVSDYVFYIKNEIEKNPERELTHFIIKNKSGKFTLAKIDKIDYKDKVATITAYNDDSRVYISETAPPDPDPPQPPKKFEIPKALPANLALSKSNPLYNLVTWDKPKNVKAYHVQIENKKDNEILRSFNLLKDITSYQYKAEDAIKDNLKTEDTLIFKIKALLDISNISNSIEIDLANNQPDKPTNISIVKMVNVKKDSTTETNYEINCDKATDPSKKELIVFGEKGNSAFKPAGYNILASGNDEPLVIAFPTEGIWYVKVAWANVWWDVDRDYSKLNYSAAIKVDIPLPKVASLPAPLPVETSYIEKNDIVLSDITASNIVGSNLSLLKGAMTNDSDYYMREMELSDKTMLVLANPKRAKSYYKNTKVPIACIDEFEFKDELVIESNKTETLVIPITSAADNDQPYTFYRLGYPEIFALSAGHTISNMIGVTSRGYEYKIKENNVENRASYGFGVVIKGSGTEIKTLSSIHFSIMLIKRDAYNIPVHNQRILAETDLIDLKTLPTGGKAMALKKHGSKYAGCPEFFAYKKTVGRSYEYHINARNGDTFTAKGFFAFKVHADGDIKRKLKVKADFNLINYVVYLVKGL